jgi:hypothetical protein
MIKQLPLCQWTHTRRLLSKPDSRVIMNSRSKLLIFMFAVVFLSSLIILPAMRVKADSTQPIAFSSGLTLYSPLNTTYSSTVLECNGTFVGPIEYEASLNYSIDGNYQGSLPWTLNQNLTNSATYTLEWAFQLPQLTKGAHQLSIGVEEQLFSSAGVLEKQTTSVNTVGFTINRSQPTPTVFEFSLVAILLLIVAVLLITLYLRHRDTAKQVT